MNESENPITPLPKKPISKPGRKPKEVWNFFMTFGEKRKDIKVANVTIVHGLKHVVSQI